MTKKKAVKKKAGKPNLFGEAIRQIMVHQKLTPYSLGLQSGVANARIYSIIKGEQYPSFKTLFRLSKALGYKRPDKFFTEICNIIEFIHKKNR